MSDAAPDLEALARTVGQEWPAVKLDPHRFARAALEAWTATGRTDPMTKLALPDLYLACACLEGDAAALETLDEMLRTVAEQVSRTSDVEASEVCQLVRHRLLMARPEEGPRLSLYRGRGALMVFLRVVTLNVVRNLKAPLAAREAPASLLDDLVVSMNPERRVAALDQQARFREAFKLAVSKLSLRERSILRLNLLEGLSIDDLAPMYQVHRSTMARWLADAKQVLATNTKAQLSSWLNLSSLEADELLTSLQGQFELTLSGVLRDSEG